MPDLKRKEIFHIAGDTPEQVAAMEPDARGPLSSTATVNMANTAVGHPIVYYKAKDGREFVLTADVYKLDGEPFKVTLLCPLCHNGLDVKGDRKQIEYAPRDPLAMMMPDEHGETKLTDMGGRLDIEKFGCTWEIDSRLPVASGDVNILVSSNTCKWRVAIDKNVARDA